MSLLRREAQPQQHPTTSRALRTSAVAEALAYGTRAGEAFVHSVPSSVYTHALSTDTRVIVELVPKVKALLLEQLAREEDKASAADTRTRN